MRPTGRKRQREAEREREREVGREQERRTECQYIEQLEVLILFIRFQSSCGSANIQCSIEKKKKKKRNREESHV